MAEEEIIKRILRINPELSREEIIEKLKMERRKTRGLIKDETLLRMIASKMGVKIPQETSPPEISIRDLVPGLNDVTITGRVVAVFLAKTLEKANGGKFASLLVIDKSGVLKVVLWNDKASFVESGMLKVGEVTRFSHAYTKEGWDGKVELHIGDKSEIKINPKGVEKKNYPTISKFTTKISGITEKQRKVNIVGIVKKISSPSTFKRHDLSAGKVMRFLLVDETGEISIVAWNKKVDELEKTLKKGVKLRIINAKVKKTLSGSLEVHVNPKTYVETLKAFGGEFIKISDLKEGLGSINIEGDVATKPMFRDVKTSRGEVVGLAVFELKDETGRIWVSTWRKHANDMKDLKVGDRLIIKNAYVKKGFGDQLEISTRKTTSIKILHKP